MLEKLFKYPAVLFRQRSAPLLEERERYLTHRAEDGCSNATLLRIARELFQITQLLDIPSKAGITSEQIRNAGKRWARQQCCRGRIHRLKWSYSLFVQVATDWLRFLGRLDESAPELPSYAYMTQDFSLWMQSERGLSPVTVRNYCWHVNKFLNWFADPCRSFSTCSISDVDTFLASRGDEGWSRVSIATSAKALKAFFHYAGQRNWCTPEIAVAIQGPRLFIQEALPSGPTWDDVNRLTAHVATNLPQDIRDRALILLFALYGFRSGEVAKLRLEDINWENNQISVSRPKQRKTQIYPLVPVVGNAIIHYLRAVRPTSCYREIFLTLKAPIQPLSAGGLYNVVCRCMTAVELQMIHKGPHSLRHACAIHLVSEGFSLKEIGDHLGHNSTSATRIYAKVNLPQLRLVADFDLGGLS